MQDDAWDVFMLGLDRDAVAREWAPPLEQVIGERPLPGDHEKRRVEVQRDRELRERARGRLRLQAAMSEVERMARREEAKAREMRAFLINQAKVRKAA